LQLTERFVGGGDSWVKKHPKKRVLCGDLDTWGWSKKIKKKETKIGNCEIWIRAQCLGTHIAGAIGVPKWGVKRGRRGGEVTGSTP